MRYHILHDGNMIAETEYLDFASAAVLNSPMPVGLLDTFTGKSIIIHAKTAPYSLVSKDNEYGLPLGYIRGELMTGLNSRIRMIKLVRELTGLDLAQAKQVIDRIEASERARVSDIDNDPRDW